MDARIARNIIGLLQQEAERAMAVGEAMRALEAIAAPPPTPPAPIKPKRPRRARVSAA